MRSFCRAGLGLLLGGGTVYAQQISDLDYRPPVPRPAYAMDAGPRVVIDEAHGNFHTADGRYRPFAGLLRRDGYRVDRLRESLAGDALKNVDVLVIANPLHARNRTPMTFL